MLGLMSFFNALRRRPQPLLRSLACLLLASFAGPVTAQGAHADPYAFTVADQAFLSQFTLKQLPPLPSAPGNLQADNPAAAELGRVLFFDKKLSANGEISCAHCHQPERAFTDGLSVPQALGKGRRNTPSLLGAAYSPWQYRDGRKDSLWAQALAPLLDENEHGMTRQNVVAVIEENYRQDYEAIFGPLSSVSQVFANVGKAIMAYERLLIPGASKFDDFVDALAEPASKRAVLSANFSSQEVKGLRLFVGKARCASCHNGPLFTNSEFHNVGTPEADVQSVDLGRYSGIEGLREDEFSCLSAWSDAAPEQCLELKFLKRQGPELVGAFRTPSLRNVALTAPYMHAGQFKTLEEVVAHYNKPTPPFYDRQQHPSRPHFDITPLGLDEKERSALVAFLKSLSSKELTH